MKRIYLLYLLLGILPFISCNDDDNGDSPDTHHTPGDVRFKDSVFNKLETDGIINIEILLSHPAEADYTLEVAVSLENNMIEDKDYILAETKVPVKKGESTAVAAIELIDNRLADPGRCLELRIMDAGGGKILAPSRCRINIIDDESECAVLFRHREISCYENAREVRIPVCMAGNPAGKTVSFKVAQTGGTAVEGKDFTTASPLEFELTGTNDTSYIVITPTNDNQSTAERTIVYEITEVRGAGQETDTDNCLVRIQDDDISVSFGRARMNVAETDIQLSVPIRLTQSISQELTVNLTQAEGTTAQEGTDFTFDKSVIIPAGQDSAVIEVKVNNIAGISPDKKIILEITGTNNGQVLVGNQKKCEITVWDCSSELQFGSPQYMCLSTDKTMKIPVKLAHALEHDVTFSIGSSDSRIFKSVRESYTLPAGETATEIELSVIPPMLQKRQEITVSFSETYGAAGTGTTLATIRFRLNKGAWSMAGFSSEETAGENGAATNLIDDNEATMWHNKWYGVTAPYELPWGVIDLGGMKHMTHLELVRRQNNSDTQKVKVYTTTDTDWQNAQWHEETTIQFGAGKTDADGRRTVEWGIDTYRKATFIRLEVIAGNANNNAASLAEMTLWGWQE